jgi:hypothetical protein
MITGHNTDVEYKGKTYHVQTEDKGINNPVIESLIYIKGHILGSRKTSYADLLAAGGGEKEIQARLEAQHKRMLLDVRGGKYSPEGPPPFGDSLISKRSLDEVVREYLRGLKGDETLELIVQAPPHLLLGSRGTLEVHARTRGKQKPIPGVAISIRISHPNEGETELFHGETDKEGNVEARFDVPPLEVPNAALIVEATSEQGQEQTRMLVHHRATAPAEPQPA